MVLVVDDFIDTCLILQQMLEQHGFSTQCANSAHEAESVLRDVKPRVIVLDYTMPDRSGLELLQDLRADHRFVDVPVIMFSALADQKLVTRARHLGAEWVVKGRTGWNQLVSKINELHG